MHKILTLSFLFLFSLPCFAQSPFITTIAGDGNAGYSGDWGIATRTSLNHPWDVAVHNGHIYIADALNHRIRKIDKDTGIISTVAGIGQPGLWGQGGPATEAPINTPWGLCVDGQGNIFIADRNNNRIQKVDAQTGILTSIVGRGNPTYSGDGSSALQADLNSPSDVFVDEQGNIFIADQFNHRIRKVDQQTGIITTVAGNGSQGFGGDGGPATQASLYHPTDVYVNAQGDIFFTARSDNRVRKVDQQTGIITTIAGNGVAGFSGDGELATQATLNFPSGVWGDQNNNIYIADTFNNRIRKISPQGIITTVAGNGSQGFGGDGGPATQAILKAPSGLFVEPSGKIYIADTQNNRIRVVDTNIPTISVVSTLPKQSVSLGGETLIINIENPILFKDTAQSPLNYSTTSTNTTVAEAKIKGHFLEITATGFGQTTVTVTAQNTLGASNNISFIVTVDNHAPTAVSDTVFIPINGRININVTQNDWDTENDTFRVSDVRDGFQSERVVLNDDGTIHYRPNNNYVGTDYFTYKIQDQHGGKSQTTVWVMITPELQSGFTLSEKIHFPPTPVGQTSFYTFSAQNPLQTDWTISQMVISGAQSTSFSIEPTTFTLPLNAPEKQFHITFTPTFNGPHTGTLSIHHTGSDTPLQIALQGDGLSASVGSSGIIVTYAGLGRIGFEEHVKLATETFLNQPNWVATDAQGNLYIADRENKRVRMVNVQTGILETIAGNGDAGYWRNGADPKGTLLTNLEGIAVDNQNNVYITSHNWVWRIEAESGLIFKYAGAADGGFGDSGDGGAATKARIREPKGIGVDNQGNLYIADSRNHRIRKVDAKTGIITTIAGNGTQGHSGDGGPATQAMLFAPEGIHADQMGNLYIADWGNNRIRKVDAQTQIITTIAGNGQPGYEGDSGLATQAKLSSPFGLVTDNDGNVFFADGDNACIRKIDGQTGIITTVIGNGRRGHTGDGGPAHTATLATPHGLATDVQGNLFIADTENHVIRKVISFITPPLIVQGIIEDQLLTVGDAPHTVDINTPSPLFLPADGSLHISVQSSDTTIVSVKIEGTLLHLQAKQLGTSNITLTAQNSDGKKTTSNFQAIANNHRPQAVNDTLVTAPGTRVNIYVLHNDIDVDGDIISVVSTSNGQKSERVVINSDGSVHYRPLTPFEGTDQFTYTIQDQHNSQSQGTVTIKYEHNDTPRLQIEGTLTFPTTAVGQVNTSTITLKNPSNKPLEIESITITGANLQDFVIDNFTHLIVPANNEPIDLPILFMPQQGGNRTATLSFQIAQLPPTQITATGTGHHTITKVAGSGRRGFDGDNGPATDAALQFPADLSVTDNGDIYLIDTRNNRARKIEAATGIITTIAGNGEQRSSGDSGLATIASLSWPEGITTDADGNVYISDTLGNKIRFVDHNTGIISAYAGNGVRGFGGDGGPSTSAQLYGPSRIFLAPSGHLYIADYINDRIRKVDAQTKIITTVAGNGTEGFSGDGGPATQASLAHPTSVWVDKHENLYIADFRNDRIRKVDAQTQIITSVAGTGNQGFSGDDGPATLAMLYSPYTVAVDGAGNIFVSDGGNQRIRRIDGQTNIITTVAGTGTNEASGDNGPAHLAGVNHPRAVFLDQSGNLYLSDSDNFIRKISRIGVPFQNETEIQSSLFTRPDTLQIETNGKTNISLIENDFSNTTLKMSHVSKGIYTDIVVINSDNTVHYRPKPNFKGIDRFTYIIQNSYGQTALGHVVVYVGIQATAPQVQTEIPNIEIIQDALPFTRQLKDDPAIFIDEDGDPLSFAVEMSDTTIVNAMLSGSTLTITPLNIGKSTIILKATDNSGNEAQTQFLVSVIERPSGLMGASSPQALIQALNTRFKLKDVVSLTGPLDNDKRQDVPLHFISTLPTQSTPNEIQLLRLNTEPIFSHLPQTHIFSTQNIIDHTDSTATYQVACHFHPDSSATLITLSFSKKSDHWFVSNMPNILNQMLQITRLENHPKILNLIPDQQMKVNSPPFSRDLLAPPPVFGTPDQRTLTFLASSSDTFAIAGIAQNRLQIAPISTGQTKITLTAIDSLGQQITLKFNVEIIPNPTPTPDFNTDGKVDFSDFILFAEAFGSNDPNYDLNGDGQVSFPDFILFGSAFGN